MSERKLTAWQQAGLIDADAAARIRAYEAEHAQPLGIWALVALGALAVGLGLISVVAANWDAIPGEVRLGVHFALMAAFAAFLWWRMPSTPPDSDYFNDGLLFIAGALGLTFFGHLGQVYQTSSPLWQPLLAWLLLFSPLLLMFGRGWPAAAMWQAAVLGTAWNHAEEHGDTWINGARHAQTLTYPTLYWGLIFCPVMVVAALAAMMRGRSTRPMFWRLQEQLAVATILAVTSIFIIAWGIGERSAFAPGSILIHSLFLFGAAAATAATRRSSSGRATAAIVCAAATIHLGQLLPPYRATGDAGVFNLWIGGGLFMLLWAIVAWAALYAGWRRMFQLAVGLLAVRLIILSFELNTNLLGSGFSLIVSGLFALGIAWVTIRISRRYAPPREQVA